MKDKLNLSLLAVFLLSVPVCVWAWLYETVLLLYITVVPAFCLQLLLCRAGRRKVVKAAPTALLLVAAALGVWYLQKPGWDSLGGLILLFGSIAPAVGIGIGWLTYLMLRRAGR